MSIMYASIDAVCDDPNIPKFAYRHLLVELNNRLGSEECRKLCFLAADIGMSKSQIERVQQALDIFDELESRMLISADDVSLLMEMMTLIHRKDLVTRIQSVYKNSVPLRTGYFSQFRVLLLEIADNTSSSDLQTMKHACTDILGRQVISKLKDAIQLFFVLEERGKLAPTNMDFLKELLMFCGNRSMLEKVYTFIMTAEETPKVPTDMEIMDLSSHLGTEWKKLGTYLGLTYHQLEAINYDFHKTQDKIVAMLTAWRESSGKDAYKSLSKALKSCHRMGLAKTVEALAASKASVPATSTVRLTHHVTMQPQPVHQQQPVWYPPTQLSPTPLMIPADFRIPPSISPSVHTGLPDTTQHGYRMDLPDDVLEDLSGHLAADWQKVGTLLQIDNGTMIAIDSKCHDSGKKALEILKTWRNRLPLHKNGTSTLASILKVSGWLDLSEKLKGTESATNALTAQMQQMETSISSGSTPSLQPGQINETNQDKTNMENLVVQSEGTREEAYQQTPHVQDHGANDKTSTNQRTKVSQKSYPHYRMNRNPRGLCMIINNKTFSGPRNKILKQRNGSEIDTGKLHNLFNKLQFEVAVKTDMTSQEMYDWFREVSQMDHSQYDCFACCIMSHGELGAVHGSDGKSVEIQDIVAHFKSIACRSLVNKPKLFFIQACQGTVSQEGIETDEPHGMGETRKTLPKEADFLLSYATVPGYVSYRSTSKGSWYVSALVDNITKHHNELDLIAILTLVNNQLSEAEANVPQGDYKQVASSSNTLRKIIYLRSLPT